MSSYGVTPEGFNLKRLDDIKTEMETDIQEIFGQVNVAPDSVFGQLIGVFSKACADVWEAVENAYNSLYPSTAEGAALDNVLQLSNGLTRIPATKTQVAGIVTGDESTLILTGSQAQTTEGIQFESLSDVTISKAAVLKTVIEITEASVGFTYHAYIDAVDYFVTSGGETKEILAVGLALYINTNLLTVTASVSGAEITIVVNDKITPFSIDVGAKMSLNERWTPIDFLATTVGVQLAVAYSLTEIVTPVTGWDAVDNLQDGIVGTETETDVEARLRRANSLKVVGAGALEAIVARIINEVDGVTAAAGFENREDYEVDSRPPHSFELVVFGGVSQDIGEEIWRVKPAGIETYGNVAVPVEDSNGDTQIMYFSRAIPRYVHVEVTITLYSEEDFPSDGVALLKQAIYDYGIALPMGKDLIIQRWLTPVFTVPGIATATIRQAAMLVESDPPSWSAANIAIGATSIATMSLDRITII
jgi:uncharacterized phage protein gp47/JayE